MNSSKSPYHFSNHKFFIVFGIALSVCGCSSEEQKQTPLNSSQKISSITSEAPETTPRAKFQRVVRRIPISMERDYFASPLYLSIDERIINQTMSEYVDNSRTDQTSSELTLIDLIRAIQSENSQQYEELQIDEGSVATQDNFKQLTELLAPENNIIIDHCFAFGRYRYFFILTGNESFPYLPFLLAKQEDGRWKRLRSIELNKLGLFGSILMMYHLKHTSPEKFTVEDRDSDAILIALPIDGHPDQDHELFFGWYPLCQVSIEISNDPETSVDNSDQFSECSPDAQTAAEFYMSIWPILKDGTDDEYLELLAPWHKKYEQRMISIGNREDFSRRVSYKKTITGVYVNEHYALIAHTLEQGKSKLAQYHLLWRDQHGNFLLPGLEIVGSFYMFTQIPTVREALLKEEFFQE